MSEDLESFELSTDTVSVCCTPGKLTVWFGKMASEKSVVRMLYAIARVIASASCELEVRCPYEKIALYESNGFVVSSYAKQGGSYRVMFTVPFSSPGAIRFLAGTIMEELKTSSTTKVFYWGREEILKHLYEELEYIEDWTSKNVKYREETE